MIQCMILIREFYVSSIWQLIVLKSAITSFHKWLFITFTATYKSTWSNLQKTVNPVLFC